MSALPFHLYQSLLKKKKEVWELGEVGKLLCLYIVYLEIRFDFLARILETVMESIEMKDITTLIMPSNNPGALVGKWNLILALTLFFYGILHLLFYVQRKRFENVYWTIFLLVFSKEILSWFFQTF